MNSCEENLLLTEEEFIKMSDNVPPRIDLCKEFAARIERGEFDSPEPEDLDVVNQIPFIQIRDSDNIENIIHIADSVNTLNGSIEKTNPVTIWEEAGQNESDIGGDGNTTRQGLSQSIAKKIKTRRIPKKVWSSLEITIEEIRAIGTILNKPPEVIKIPNSDETIIKQLIEIREKYDIDFKDQYMIDYLQVIGIVGQKRKQSIINKATNEYEKNKAYIAGKKVKTYGTKVASAENNKLLKDVEESLRDSKTMVVSGSTGCSKTIQESIIREMILDTNSQKHDIVLVLYHNSFANESQWKGNHGNSFLNRIKKLLEKMKPVECIQEDNSVILRPYTLKCVYMPMLEDDMSTN